MNKLLPILLVVALSGCASLHTHTKYTNYKNGNNINKLIEARNQCSSELGGKQNYTCGEFYQCLKIKGWDSQIIDPLTGRLAHSTVNHGQSDTVFEGIEIPKAYRTKCDFSIM